MLLVQGRISNGQAKVFPSTGLEQANKAFLNRQTCKLETNNWTNVPCEQTNRQTGRQVNKQQQQQQQQQQQLYYLF